METIKGGLQQMDVLITIKNGKKGCSKTFKRVEFVEINDENKIEILSADERGSLCYDCIQFNENDAVEIKRF